MRTLLPLLLLVALATAFVLWIRPTPSAPAAAPGVDDRPAAMASSEGAELARAELAEDAAARAAAVEVDRDGDLREAQGFELAGARWVDVRVVGPADLPADERAWVVGLDPAEVEAPDPASRASGAASLAASTLSKIRSGGVPEWMGARWSVRALAADGTARVPFPADAGQGFVALVSRYRRAAALLVRLPEDAPQRLEASAAAWLTGRVRSAASCGSEVRVESVWLERPSREALHLRAPAQARVAVGAGGSFEVLGLAPGDVLRLTARAAGAAESTLELSAAPLEHVVRELVLDCSVQLSGRVLDEDGVGVARVLVSAAAQEEPSPEWLRTAPPPVRVATDADGGFTLRGLPASGRLRVEVQAEGWLPVPAQDVELVDGVAAPLTFTLRHGPSITGRVVSCDGAPAAGARVTGVARRGDARSSVRADDDGRFVLGGLAQGSSYDLTAELPAHDFPPAAPVPVDGGKWSLSVSLGETQDEQGRHGRATLGPVIVGAREVELVLTEDLRLAGSVVDERGEPVRRFHVLATPLSGTGRSASGTFEEDDGSFALAGLYPGVHDVSVSAEGHVTTERSQARVTLPLVAGAEGGLRLELVRELRVRGMVLDASGAPAAGATVVARAGSASLFSIEAEDETTTDAEGRFALGCPPSGAALVASAAGRGSSLAEPVRGAPGGELDGLVLCLRRGAVVTGEVLDSAGRPIEGAAIDVLGGNGEGMGGSDDRPLLSDGQGRFRIEGVSPGPVVVSALPHGPGPSRPLGSLWEGLLVQRLDVEDGEEVHVVLRERSSAPVRVEGSIVGERTGLLLRGFVLATQDTLLGRQTPFEVDRDGRFEVTVERPGEHAFVLFFDGGSSLTELRDVPAVATHTVRIELPSARLEGRVLDPEGAPVPLVPLQLGGATSEDLVMESMRRTESDAEGRFAFEHLAAGTYLLRVAPAYLLEDEPRPWGARTVGDIALEPGGHARLDVRLEPAGTLSGLVRDQTGQPVAGASVFVRDASGALLSPISAVESDAAGAFEHTGLGGEPVTVFARTGDRRSLEVGPLRVRPGEPATVTLELLPAARLSVSVVDASGPARARLELRQADGTPGAATLTRADAERLITEGLHPRTSVLGPLLPGAYEVHALADDGREAHASLRLEAGEERALELRLE